MASSRLTSPVGRVAYPTLVKGRKRNENAKPRLSLTLVFGPDVDLTEFKDQLRSAILEEYPNGPPAGFKNPLRPGKDRVREDGSYPDGFGPNDIFCEFWRYEDKGPIPCVDQARNTLLASDVYAGMLGRVIFRPFVYKVEGNKGCGLGLEAFQKSADGKPIGFAPVDAHSEFSALSGATAESSAEANVDAVLGF